MQSSIPSLTLDGWIDNKHLQMRKLWEYFMASEYSQSNTFFGNIASLKYILATELPSNSLASKIEEVLSILYNRYFDSSSVSVYIDDKELNKYKFTIAITCTDENNEYYLNRELVYSNGKIETYESLLDDLYDQYVK